MTFDNDFQNEAKGDIRAQFKADKFWAEEGDLLC